MLNHFPMSLLVRVVSKDHSVCISIKVRSCEFPVRGEKRRVRQTAIVDPLEG